VGTLLWVNDQSCCETVVFALLTGCGGAAWETRQVEVFTSPNPPVSKVLTRRLHHCISDVPATTRRCQGRCQFCHTVEQACWGLHHIGAGVARV